MKKPELTAEELKERIIDNMRSTAINEAAVERKRDKEKAQTDNRLAAMEERILKLERRLRENH